MNSNYQTIVSVLGRTTYNVSVSEEMKRSTGDIIRLLCDTRLGEITINLPKISAFGGAIDMQFLVDDIADNASVNNINIVCDVADKIENAANYKIQTDGGKAQFYVSNRNEYGVLALGTSAPSSGVKVFKALVKQSGMIAPAFVNILVNDLGEVPTLNYEGAGKYTLTVVAGLFTIGKTSVIGGSSSNTVGLVKINPANPNTVEIHTYNVAGAQVNDVLALTTILIEIYP